MKRKKDKIKFIKNEKPIEEKFSIKIEKGKKYTKYDIDNLPKTNYTFNYTFINVYDLIFTLKNIDENNVIILEQNDIENILENMTDEEMNFLLNLKFSYKTTDEELIRNIPIKSYLKIKNLNN